MARAFEDEPVEVVDAPVACDLAVFTRDEAARHRELLAALRAATTGRSELDDGWALRLSGKDSDAATAAEWITLERRCCPFFTFALVFEPGGATWLRITGPAGAKEVLAEAMGQSPA
jgi:hypothetical protein